MTITPKILAQIRAETPACASVLHFNNAGAGLMPDPVFKAVTDHLTRERDIGGYEADAEAEADGRLPALYTSLAMLLGAKPSEVAFVENATRAWDMAFYALTLKAGDRIITHASEYVSNILALLHMAKKRGVEIDFAPSDATGQIDVAALPGIITSRTRLIALTHIPTSGGLINPAAEVGRVAREHGLIYLLDACQSVGQLELDVAKIGCHILSGTGRKFLRGPRGTGFLYVAGDLIETLDPPFIDVRAADWISENEFKLAPGARRFENWESFVAGRLGLAAAIDYAMATGMDAIEERALALGATLRDRLSTIKGVKTHDLGARKSGIVTFAIDGVSSGDFARKMVSQRINITHTTPENSKHDLAKRGLPALVRASVHYYNTEDEIERFAQAVEGAR